MLLLEQPHILRLDCTFMPWIVNATQETKINGLSSLSVLKLVMAYYLQTFLLFTNLFPSTIICSVSFSFPEKNTQVVCCCYLIGFYYYLSDTTGARKAWRIKVPNTADTSSLSPYNIISDSDQRSILPPFHFLILVDCKVG